MSKKSPIQFSLFCILLLLPAVFNPWGDSVFIVPKMFFLKILSLTLFCTIFIRLGYQNIFVLPRDLLAIPIFVSLFAKSVSTIFSIHFQTSYQELEGQLFYFLFYICGIFVISDIKRRDISVVITVIVSAVISLYALLQVSGIDFVLWSDPTVFVRPSSTLGNPNFLAAYISIVLPFAFYQLFYSGSFISKFFISASCIIISTALLHTYTRGGWLACLTSLTVFFLLIDKKHIRKNIFYLLFVLIAISGIFLHLNKKKIEIERQKVNLYERATSVSPSTFVRLNLWNDSLYLTRDGFPVGFGLDTYPLCYPKRRSIEILRLQVETALPEHAHNEILQTSVCEGIFGVFSYFFLVFAIFYCAIKNIKKRENNLTDITILSSYIAYIVQSMFNPKIVDVKFLFYFLAILLSFQNGISFHTVEFSKNHIRAKIISSLLVLSAIISLVPYTFKPFLADRWFRKATDAMQFGDGKTALVSLHKAVSLNISSVHYLRHAAIFTRKVAEVSKDEKIFKEAIKLLKIAEEINPKDASLYADLGRLYTSYFLTLGKDKTEDAIFFHKKAISLDPKFPIFHNDLGITYINSGKFKEGEECFLKAIEIVPDWWEPYFNMGILYFRKKEIDKAISWAKKSIIKAPDNPVCWGNLILFLETAERKDEVFLYLKKARKQFPFDKHFKAKFEEVKKQKSE